MFLNNWGKRIARVLAFAYLFAASRLAYAQGCAMCYTTAAAAKAAAIRALKSGILILLIPPLLMFIAIFVFAYRRRNSFSDGTAGACGRDRELNEWLDSVSQDEEIDVDSSQLEYRSPRR